MSKPKFVFVKRLYLGSIIIFLYAPIAVLMAYSFNASRSRSVWGGFTLDWYASLFKNQTIMDALYYTLIIAFIASIVATLIGTAAAIGINNMRKIPKSMSMSITNLPVLNPDIVTGISLMILFIFARNVFGVMRLGFLTLLLAHITFNIPYVILSVLPKIRQLDANLYEAALDLGASPFYAFTKVILPELWQGIITGAIFAFTLSLDDFVISYFTTGRGVSNLSIYIYTTTAKRGVSPEIYALSTLIFAAIIILLALINKRDKQELRENF